METETLYSIAENHKIKVDRFCLSANKSISLNIQDHLFVALDNNIYGANEKVCLAHELGHCETLSFYNIYSPLDVRGKHERRADIWAINKLVPRQQLEYAIKQGYRSLYDLAEFFGVTTVFMRKAIEYHNQSQN